MAPLLTKQTNHLLYDGSLELNGITATTTIVSQPPRK
jgi:hypothetical protein